MQITLRTPDDWHLHLRDGAVLNAVGPVTAGHFARALIMPNLVPPVTTPALARSYRERIMASVGSTPFDPRLTCYLTDEVDPDVLVQGWWDGAWIAAKLYPAHATTNADAGVTDLACIRPALERMEAVGMPLCVHGEVTHREVDIFDRERVFIQDVLRPLLEDLPHLRVVFEHATTADAVAFVQEFDNVCATITPHHLWWNRNAIFDGGLRPHAYCLPVLKRERDREALVAAATSGDPCFFAGTDSAPHTRDRKECDHGCAGVFNAPTAVAAYAQVFQDAGALEQLESFLSLHGAHFYGVPPNTSTITLREGPWTPPRELAVEGAEPIEIFLGGTELRWHVES